MLDLFCGTASMAMACYDAGVEYLGLEADESVVIPARCRLGAYVMYSKLIDRPPIQLRLGTEPTEQREVDAIASVLALSHAALLPASNVPREHSSEIAFQVHAYLPNNLAAGHAGEALAVHAQQCQCNVDPTKNLIVECEAECLKLMVRPSDLSVLLYFNQIWHDTLPIRPTASPSAKVYMLLPALRWVSSRNYSLSEHSFWRKSTTDRLFMTQ